MQGRAKTESIGWEKEGKKKLHGISVSGASERIKIPSLLPVLLLPLGGYALKLYDTLRRREILTHINTDTDEDEEEEEVVRRLARHACALFESVGSEGRR